MKECLFTLLRAFHTRTHEGNYVAGVSVVKPGEVVTRETVRHGEHTADTVEDAYLEALKGAAGELCPQVLELQHARAFVDENDRTTSYVQVIANGAVITTPVVAPESPSDTSHWIQPEGAAVGQAVEQYIIFCSDLSQK